MRELTTYEAWQMEKYGDLYPVPDMEIDEPGEEDAERFAEWMMLNAERNLKEYE